MSALRPKADLRSAIVGVRYGPETAISVARRYVGITFRSLPVVGSYLPTIEQSRFTI